MQTLRLVLMLEGRADASACVESARALVDEYVERARCSQAILMRCEAPRAVYSLDHSMYEEACGIHGQHNLHRDWCTRFLRGVGAEGIWLGCELMARVDREALAAVCHLDAVGETTRAVLRDGATLDALEAVLAALLPSEEDWQEAARARSAEAREALRALGVELGEPPKPRRSS